MLNFKSRKGEIATLLTLGLVLVGTLITLGTSLFVSNQKNNLALNSRAALYCPTGSHCIASTFSCKGYYNQVENTNADCTFAGKEGICCYNSTTTPAPSPTLPIPTGKVGSGNRFLRDPNEGYNPSLCPNTGLEFACCVEYDGQSQCTDQKSYTWYGCTGQYCRNTIIKQSNGPGNLVACPSGLGEGANKSCAVIPTATPAAGGSGKPCYAPRANPSKDYSYWTCDSPYVCTKRTTSGGTCVRPSATPRPISTPISTQTPSESGTPTPIIPINTPGPSPVLNPSNNCVSPPLQCPEPHNDIYYSYKCATIPQTINGIIECPIYNFYGGQICKGNVLNGVNLSNVIDIYCNSNYTTVEAKRTVLISYTIDQVGALIINPDDPIIRFTIFDDNPNAKPTKYVKEITIGQGSTHTEDVASLETSSNILKWTIDYVPLGATRRNGLRVLQSGQINIINGEASINIQIKQ